LVRHGRSSTNVPWRERMLVNVTSIAITLEAF
jgi:hypothetical protein